MCAVNTGIVDHKQSGLYSVSIYPNPTRAFATLKYSLPQNGVVLLNLYNLLGKEVSTLSQGNRSAGIYSQSIDATSLPGGVYYYKLVVNGTPVNTGKVIVSK